MLPAFINFHILKALSDRYFFLKVGKGSATDTYDQKQDKKFSNFETALQLNWNPIVWCHFLGFSSIESLYR